MRKESLIWIAAALVAASAQGQERPPEKAAQLVPLVQLQGYEFTCSVLGTVGFFGFYCVDGTARERSVTVFRSGRVLSAFTGTRETRADDPSAPVVYTPLPSEARDLRASRRSIVDLIAFLDAEGISGLTSPCDPLPGSAADPGRSTSFARYSIVWFEPDGQRFYTDLDSGATRSCPPQVHAVFDALVAFGETGTRPAG